MKRKLLSLAAVLCAATTGAQAQISDNLVKIGVLNDMSGVYADISGPSSIWAAKAAVEDYIKATGSKLKVEVIGADHQNKPDVGSNIARKWFDTDQVDAIVDVPTSSVALAVNQVAKEKGKIHLNTGAATADLTGKACTPNTIHWLYDTWMLANATGKALSPAALEINKRMELNVIGSHPSPFTLKPAPFESGASTAHPLLEFAINEESVDRKSTRLNSSHT